MSAPVLAPLNALREQMGLAGVTDWRGSVEKAHAILAFTYETFDTAPPGYTPTHLHYVGPLACLRSPFPPIPCHGHPKTNGHSSW